MRLRATKKNILNGNILEQMLIFLFPLFVGYLLQTLYGIVDNIVLGRIVGKQALAAVGGSATSIINIINNFVSGMAAAITVLVAQNYGRGNMNKVSESVKTGMFVSIVVGGLLTLVMNLAARPLLNLMAEPVETINLSLTYMRLYFFSLIPYFIYQSGVSILRALGDSKRPLYLIMVTAVSKILFDLLLAGVFKLGVTGTSLATFLSHLVCALIILFIFERTVDVYQYSIKNFGFEKEDLIQIFKIGIPFSIQSMLFAIPNAVIQRKINTFGTDSIAAYTAFNSVDNLFWCFSNSVGTATITLAGQNYGNGNMKRVKKIAYTSILVEFTGAVIYGIVFYTFGTHILSLFLKDPEVIVISKRILNVISCSYWTYLFLEPLSAVFKSVGLTNVPVYIAVFTILISRIVYIYTFDIKDVAMAVVAFPISWVLTSLAYLAYFLINKKFRIDDKKEKEIKNS